MDHPLTSPAAGIEDPGAWTARREVLQSAWRRLTGTVPAPGAWVASPVLRLAARRFDGGTERRLAVGTPPLRLRILVPDGVSGDAPVLLVQESHPTWAAAALRRGWAACLVSACDAEDDTEAIASTLAGRHDGGRIAWRAWALSRALDVLEREPGVDARRVVVAGHSRNGKAALLAAAFDERFAGVVSSSSGVLGAIPAVLCRDRHFGEGIDLLVRHYPGWYHPRLAEWAGREEELPADAHDLLALAAPRPVLVSVAVNDPVESTWAAERSVGAAREAYALLGAPDALELRWRPGGHELSSEGVEAMLDWVCGDRGSVAEELHGGGFVPWRPEPGGRSLEAALGTAPPRSRTGAVAGATGERPHAAWLLGRGDVPVRPAVTADGVDVALLGPADGPRALWLGPLCRATGWVAGYEDGPGLPAILADHGWSVACHDPIGTGGRILEGAAFARRHPEWSLLGRMVFDAAAAAEVAGAPVWVAAYGTGALVAAHLAAVRPDLVAGLALVVPSGDDPLVRGPVGYTLDDLLAGVRCPLRVFDGDGWHRLTPALRRDVAAWLSAARDAAAVPVA
jgi:pimeloyl-ACP methyl ester carboxylesterase